jgi:hypothetical protein
VIQGSDEELWVIFRRALTRWFADCHPRNAGLCSTRSQRTRSATAPTARHHGSGAPERSLANPTEQGIGQLSALVKTWLRRMQYRSGLIDGFLAKTGLDLTLP